MVLLFLPGLFGASSFFMPFVIAGFYTHRKTIGTPRRWLRWQTGWLARPAMATLEFALAALLAIYMYVGLFLIMPLLHVLYELFSMLTCTGWMPKQLHDDSCGAEAAPGLDVETGFAAGARTREGSSPKRKHHLDLQRQRSHDAKLRQDLAARYREFDSVWAALEAEGQPVRLLSLKWLHRHAQRGGSRKVLPRRQDLERLHPEAYLSAARLKEIEAGAKRRSNYETGFQEFLKVFEGASFLQTLYAFGRLVVEVFTTRPNVDKLLPIVAVSYCWLEMDHPDKEGRQLKLLMERLDQLYDGRGLIRSCEDYGFDDMGVFIDWASLHQKDTSLWQEWMAQPGGDEAARRRYEESRTDDEAAAFKQALSQTMDLWYGHTATTVVVLTELPTELPPCFDQSRTYATRGWTTFERCSAELAKRHRMSAASWRLVIDIADRSGSAKRRLPTTPEQMSTLLQSCRFTNGDDMATVLQLYEQTACGLLTTLERFTLMGLPLSDDDPWCTPERLAEVLNYCSNLKVLSLAATRLDNDGMRVMTQGLHDTSLPELSTLHIGGNRYGADGIEDLFSIFARGVAPKLQTLDMGVCLFGDAGVCAVAQALVRGDVPSTLKSLVLFQNDMRDEGALALAAAVLQSSSHCRPVCNNNQVGLRGQAALMRVMEHRSGVSFGVLPQIMLANPPLWPEFWYSSWARGLRAVLESGGLGVCRAQAKQELAAHRLEDLEEKLAQQHAKILHLEAQMQGGRPGTGRTAARTGELVHRGASTAPMAATGLEMATLSA